MSFPELIDAFSLDGISGGNAVFSAEKLDWMNAQYLALLPVDTLADLVRPRLAEAGLDRSPLASDASRFHRLLELLRPRAKTLREFVEQARPLLAETVEYDPAAVEKHLSTPGIVEHVAKVSDALHSLSSFDETHVETAVRGTAAERGIKAAQLIHAIRVALTGRTASPGLFEIIVLLGRDETRARMTRVVEWLSSEKVRNPQ
jgi:glutamyl-tRNA synthetase